MQAYGYGGGAGASSSGTGRDHRGYSSYIGGSRSGGYGGSYGGRRDGGYRDDYRGGGRDYHDRHDRSRDHDRYDRGGGGSRDYDRSGRGGRDADRGRGGGESSGGGGGGGGRSREEEEVLQLTRDARTIFVGQLVVRAGERDVREYFEQVGPVSDVQLIRDKSSGKSKGFGYIEFTDLESVPKALLLNGQKFCMKHPVRACVRACPRVSASLPAIVLPAACAPMREPGFCAGTHQLRLVDGQEPRHTRASETRRSRTLYI